MKRLSVKQRVIVGSTLLLLIAVIIAIVILTRTVTVPNVKGLGVTEATERLEKAGFSVEKKDIFSDRVPKNVVIMQDISPGTEVSVYRDNKVVITVSKGVDQVKMPNVTGKTKQEAIETLSALGFEIEITESFDNKCPVGSVLSQSVAVRSYVNKGSKITLVISTGPQLVTVPDITNMTLEQAIEEMASLGIEIKTRFEVSKTVKEDCVISQSVKAGDQVLSNEVITAHISLGKTANKTGNTLSNAADGSYVTSQGNWIYFCDKGDSYDLYRVRKDGSDLQLLYKGCVTAVNVVGGWVYFTDEEDSNCLYKIQIDGTELQKISTDPVYWVYVVGNTIYTTDEFVYGNIHKRDTNGKNKKLICSDDCIYINIYGNQIYYKDWSDGMVYSIDTNGKNRKLIYDRPHSCSDLVVDNGILYMNSNDKIIKLDPKTWTTQVLDDSYKQKSSLNVYDGWIYYKESIQHEYSYTSAAYQKIKTNGEEKTTVFNFKDTFPPNMFLNVIDGWVCFPYQDDNCRIYKIYNDGTDLQMLKIKEK